MNLRESIPRQVDKKSRVPEEEKVMSGVLEEEIGVWNFQEGKNKLFFFFLHCLVLVRIIQQLCILLEDSFSLLKTF